MAIVGTGRSQTIFLAGNGLSRG